VSFRASLRKVIAIPFVLTPSYASNSDNHQKHSIILYNNC
jgi:hypothetical protein